VNPGEILIPILSVDLRNTVVDSDTDPARLRCRVSVAVGYAAKDIIAGQDDGENIKVLHRKPATNRLLLNWLGINF
jgi:hypothetical protein